MFDYKCPTCGNGTVREERKQDYVTEVQGVMVKIPEAVFGVCDQCKSRVVDRSERDRWAQVACKALSASDVHLTFEEIRDLRESLGLTISEFARLLGTTRQSVHNWERADRLGPQSRTIDLLLRLV